MSFRIAVSIGSQRLSLWDGTKRIADWPCSTSRYGIGFTEGSNRTPLGGFFVQEKHGDGAESGTIFKSRQPVGKWVPGTEVTGDLVLTRILWLGGTEKRNANTFGRYIYIHGTNDERGIGQPKSDGCVRMRNADVIRLFEMVPVGTAVWISE